MSDTDKVLLARLFTEAQSQNGWRPDPVSDKLLQAAYEIAKFGPTSMNTQPMRILFLSSGNTASPCARSTRRPAFSRPEAVHGLSASHHLAASNAEQVRKVRAVLESLDHEIATPEEARAVLNLKGADRVGF